MRDPYLYEDVNVLINLLGIKEEKILENRERMISFARLLNIDSLLENNSKVDYNHYKNINKYIFGSIYEWAGEERIIDIYKSESVLSGESVEYETHKNIKKSAENIIQDMDKIPWNKIEVVDQAEKFSEYIAKLWKVHPFREGNTRTTMTFAAHYALSKGFSLDRNLIAENSKYTRDSLVMASIGNEYSNYLVKIIKDAIKNGDQEYFKDQLMLAGYSPIEKLVKDMRLVNKIYGKHHTVAEIRDLCMNSCLTKEEGLLLEKVKNDFLCEEKNQNSLKVNHFINENER